jgi:hypothetical protein
VYLSTIDSTIIEAPNFVPRVAGLQDPSNFGKGTRLVARAQTGKGTRNEEVQSEGIAEGR